MEKYLGIIFLIILALFSKNFLQNPVVLGESTPSPTEVLPINQPITTESRFSHKLQEETEVIEKKNSFRR